MVFLFSFVNPSHELRAAETTLYQELVGETEPFDGAREFVEELKRAKDREQFDAFKAKRQAPGNDGTTSA